MNLIIKTCFIATLLLCLLTPSVLAAKYGKFTYEVVADSVTITGYPDTAMGSVVIPSAINGKPVTSIADQAFSNCYRLTSVTIPESVTSIGDFAFHFCSGLTSVTIPDSVTSIGDSAFSICLNLKSMTIGSGLPTSGLKMLESIFSLTEIMVSESNPSLSSIDGILYDFSRATLIKYPSGNKRKSFAIPVSVTSIGDGAFASSFALKSVTIGFGVTSIGEGAFFSCSGLTSVTIPDSVTSIGRSAFSNCDALTSVTIGSGVTSIGEGAFSSCSGLTSVTIPDSVTSISGSAFSNCQNLKSVTIGSGLPTSDLKMLDSLSSLTAIKVSESNPNYSVIDDVLYDFSKTTLIKYPIGKREETFAIPDTVTNIGNAAFNKCSHLKRINIPESVTTVGDYAFYECENLISLNFGKRVSLIGKYSFFSCSSLSRLIIPESVTFIGTHAFRRCYMPDGFVFLGNAPEIEENVFDTKSEGRHSRRSVAALVYHLQGKTGFEENSWSGYRVLELASNPKMEATTPPKRSDGLGVSLMEGNANIVFTKAFSAYYSVEIRIRNIGAKKLRINSEIMKLSQNAKDFEISVSQGKASLRPGESTNVYLDFKPKGAGVRNATFLIRTNDPDNKAFKIKLTGNGSFR